MGLEILAFQGRGDPGIVYIGLYPPSYGRGDGSINFPFNGAARTTTENPDHTITALAATNIGSNNFRATATCANSFQAGDKITIAGLNIPAAYPQNYKYLGTYAIYSATRAIS